MSSHEASPQSPSATGASTHRRIWTPAEDEILKSLVAHYGDSRGAEGKWKEIAAGLESRTSKECRKRWFHRLHPSLRKGRWTTEEDQALLSAYARLGPAWHEIAALIPGRKDDQCSKRYNDILDPSARNRLSDWTSQEDKLLREGVATLGHRWSAIASRIPGRPPLTCRNRWRTLSRQLQSRNGKTQDTTPSSQMSPSDSGVSPTGQQQIDAAGGVRAESTEHTNMDSISFGAIETDAVPAGPAETGFLDPAFYDTFSGLSPSVTDAEDTIGAVLPSEPVLLGDLPTSFPTEPPPTIQTDTRPAQSRIQHEPSRTAPFMPPTSSWDPMRSIPEAATAPPDQSLWLGQTSGPQTSRPWDFFGDDTYIQTSQLPTTTQQTVHHYHHHHVHHHFHHYHHYTPGDSLQQLERQAEEQAMQPQTQNTNPQPNP